MVGVTAQQLQEATSFELAVAPGTPVTAAPTAEELTLLCERERERVDVDGTLRPG